MSNKKNMGLVNDYNGLAACLAMMNAEKDETKAKAAAAKKKTVDRGK